MSRLKTFLGAATLAMTIAAPIAYLSGAMELTVCKTVMLLATVVWFALAGVGLFHGKAAESP